MNRNSYAALLPIALTATIAVPQAAGAQSSGPRLILASLGYNAPHGLLHAPQRGFAGSHGSQGYLGIDIRDVSDDRLSALKLHESRGAEIIHVDHDGPAGKAGLREHDVVLQMNGQVIEGEEQLRRVLRETPAGRDVTIVLSRDGQQQTVSTQMADRATVERQAWEQRTTVPEPAPSPAMGSGFFGGAPIMAPASGAPITAPPDPHGHNFIGTVILGSSLYWRGS